MDTGSDSSDNNLGLCSLCSSINAEALASSNGYAHVPRPLDLAAQPTCKVCVMMWNDLKRDFHPESKIHPLSTLGNVRLGTAPRDDRDHGKGSVLTAMMSSTSGPVSLKLESVEVWAPHG